MSEDKLELGLGDITLIAGENGVGKTYLLNRIAYGAGGEYPVSFYVGIHRERNAVIPADGEIAIARPTLLFADLGHSNDFAWWRHYIIPRAKDDRPSCAEVLPIISAVLRAKPGELVAIEKPELGLHPAAQVRLVWLFVEAAKIGVKLAIETDSYSLMTALRVRVRKGDLNPEGLRIYWVEADGSLVSPTCDRDGRIDIWPRGFFDTDKRLLAELI